MASLRRHGWLLSAAALYACVAGLLTWPLPLHMGHHLVGHPNPGGMADPPLNAWILAWGASALAQFPTRLWQANIFYPAPDAFAFSDALLGTQILFAPLFLLTGSPVLSYNLTLLGAFVLNGLSMAVLARSLLGRSLPAILAGIVYAFAPLRFSHLIHLQLLSAWWAPLAFLAAGAWLNRPRLGVALGLVLAVWAQFLSSAYLGIMLAVLLVPFLIWRGWPDRRRLLTARPLGQAVAAGLVALLLFGAVAAPYLRSQARWGHERGVPLLLHYSARPRSFLAAEAQSWLYGALTRPLREPLTPWETNLFLGLVPLALAAFSLRRRPGGSGDDAPARPFRGYPLVFGAALLLALGPILIWDQIPLQWPLPYLPLYLLLPGFSAMRIPARFALMALVPLALFAGAGAARLQGLTRGRGGALGVAGLLTGLLLLESLHLPIPLQPIADPARAGSAGAWLAEAGDRGALLHLPFAPTDPVTETYRMLETVGPWTRLANGYSGFRPGTYFDLASLVERDGLSAGALHALEAAGVRTLAVHLPALSEGERRRWTQEPAPGSPVRLVWADPGLRVFRLQPAPGGPGRLAVRADLPSQLPLGSYTASLLLSAAAEGPWVNPEPPGYTEVSARWHPLAGGPESLQRVPVYLPWLLAAGGEYSTTLPLETPPTPGPYRLELRGPGVFTAQEVRVESAGQAAAPHQAELIWRGPARIEIAPRAPVQLPVTLVNRGQTIWQASSGESSAATWFRRLGRLRSLTAWWASIDLPARGLEWPVWGVGDGALWLATPDSFLGRFTLFVRWFRGTALIATDMFPLPADVFPGGTTTLRRAPQGPVAPGAYEVELQVLTPALVPAALAPGSAWPRIPVHVRPAGGLPPSGAAT